MRPQARKRLQHLAYALIVSGAGIVMIAALRVDPTGSPFDDLIAAGIAVLFTGLLALIVSEHLDRKSAIYAVLLVVIGSYAVAVIAFTLPRLVEVSGGVIVVLSAGGIWFADPLQSVVRGFLKSDRQQAAKAAPSSRSNRIGEACFLAGGALVIIGAAVSLFTAFRIDLAIDGALVAFGLAAVLNLRGRGRDVFGGVVALDVTCLVVGQVAAWSWLSNAALVATAITVGIGIAGRMHERL